MKTEDLKNYKEEEDKMLEDCVDWDSQTEALKEAFKRGIEIAKELIN